MGHLHGNKIIFTILVIAQPFNRYRIAFLEIALPFFHEPKGANMDMRLVSITGRYRKGNARLHIFGKFFNGNLGYLARDGSRPAGDIFGGGALIGAYSKTLASPAYLAILFQTAAAGTEGNHRQKDYDPGTDFHAESSCLSRRITNSHVCS